MTGDQLLQKLQEAPLVPVFSHEDEATAFCVLKACYEGGIRVFEFTNRSEKALAIFRHLVAHKSDFPGLVLGAGTIMDTAQCESYMAARADFIVAPIVDPAVAKLCEERGISWTPGCGTLTEMVTAERLGARLIKVFPADVLGPKFIKGVLAPCPQLNLMPTGGVTPDHENLRAWLDAGVKCVGMGSQLFPKEAIKSGHFEEVTKIVRGALLEIKKIQTS